MESLKEYLVERFKTYRNQLENSEFYINLKQRYEGLSPTVQKSIRYGFIFCLLYSIYSIPSSYTSSAREKLSFFKENRELTRQMIHASRTSSETQSISSTMTMDQLKSKVNTRIDYEQLLTEQTKDPRPIRKKVPKSILPAGNVKQFGLKAQVQKLTLKQWILLGEGLDSIENSRLFNLSLQADSKDPHYFNMEYEMISFSIPETKSKKARLKKKRRRKK